MENPAPFDLNQAILQWRQPLASSPALRREDVDELEAHLRDAIASLEGKSLSAQEAFWIARHRLGQGEALQSEFGKVNVAQVWIERAMWMVLGSFFMGVFGGLTSMLANLTVIGLKLASSLIELWPWLIDYAGLAGRLLYPLMLGWAIFAVVRRMNRHHDPLDHLIAWSRSHPILAVSTLAGFYVLLLFGNWWIQVQQLARVSAARIGLEYKLFWLIGILSTLFWLAALAWLLTKSRRSAQPSTPVRL